MYMRVDTLTAYIDHADSCVTLTLRNQGRDLERIAAKKRVDPSGKSEDPAASIERRSKPDVQVAILCGANWVWENDVIS